MNDKKNYGSQKSPGRPKFLSKRDERQVIRIASLGKLTATGIASQLAKSHQHKQFKGP